MVSVECLMDDATIAIIIPVLGDTVALCSLLERLRGWTIQPAEIIVVSAEPDLELISLCNKRDCRYLESIACRGTQLDQGVTTARSDVVWFLHADSEPHADSLTAISSSIADGAEGGYFRFKFAGKPAWWKRLLEHLILLRTRLGGIPYGDQGIFARRTAYRDAGGFTHQPLFEEVTLVKNLRTRGHFRSFALPIGVAPRRWERNGWCHRSLANRGLVIRYVLGARAERLAKRYDGKVVIERDAKS
jgi:rSAM/selenodomain-associated transferase 2